MEIKIVVNSDGRVGVEGPLQDKIFMFGILELAKDVVRTYNPAEKSIVVAKGLV